MERTSGAAASAPYPPSSITASTTYCGLGFGPKATNQLLGSLAPGLVAVPVLPARFQLAGKPWKTPLAVPFLLAMTPSSPWRIGSVMLAGRFTWPRTFLEKVLTTLPVIGFTTSEATWGAYRVPPLAKVA